MFPVIHLGRTESVYQYERSLWLLSIEDSA